MMVKLSSVENTFTREDIVAEAIARVVADCGKVNEEDASGKI